LRPLRVDSVGLKIFVCKFYEIIER
jgi:hypothetical protein